MKILQVNCVYNTGSTGKITYEIHRSLKAQGIESVVYYGRGEKCEDEDVHKICGEVYAKFQNLRSRVTGLMYGGCGLSTNRLITCIQKEKPDLVHLQCINGYFVNIYRLVQWLKEQKIKTVLTNHAEFMYTANCGHAFECDQWKLGCGNCPRLKKATKSLFFDRTRDSFQKMEQAFEGFGENMEVVTVSPWLQQRAMQSPILKDLHHEVIYNGIDTEIFCIQDTENLRNRHKIGKKKCIFHATAMFSDAPGHPKGGEYLIRLAEKFREREVVFLVAGEQQISGQLPENMILLGKVQDQKLLAKYYAMADLSVITSKRESFSMPCVESLCCGTPVIGFQAGGPEEISIPEYSEFVEFGDLDALEKCTEKWLNKTDVDRKDISASAGRIYSKKEMTEQYIRLYRRMLDES